jgi:hypothetical protein
MTVIKKYNSSTSQWEVVVVPRSGEWDTDQTIRNVNTSSNLLPADAGKLIVIDSTSATTLTVNTTLALSPGQRIDLLRAGPGAVTIAASGVTINATPGLKLRERWSVALLICTATNVYSLLGDLSA